MTATQLVDLGGKASGQKHLDFSASSLGFNAELVAQLTDGTLPVPLYPLQEQAEMVVWAAVVWAPQP